MSQNIELGEKTLSLVEIGGEIKESFKVGESEFIVIKGMDNKLYLGDKVTNTIIIGPKEGFKGLLEQGCIDSIRTEVKTNHEISEVLGLKPSKIPEYGLIVIGESIWYIYENGKRERMRSIEGYKITSY